MTIPFNIGDEVQLTINGRIKSYSADENGDCYVIAISDARNEGTRIYLDSPAMKGATKITATKEEQGNESD